MTEGKDIINPFPGLRPFSYADGKYYFGRDGQISTVIKKVIKQKFVAIIGSSGSGKSSLINAGIIPGICEDPAYNAGSSWRTISIRPGEYPISNISKAIFENLKDKNTDDEETSPEDIEELLRDNLNGLAETFGQVYSNSKEKILLVIDQFEDLFRFKRSRIKSANAPEYESFINLLVQAQKQSEIPLYVIIAIRADFLDECQVSDELNELIDNNNLILPQLSGEDFKEIINKPAETAGGKIDVQLEQQILTDIKNKKDQLPLLQHLMNRLWNHWMKEGNYEKPVSLDNYEAVGGVESALILHVEEAWQEIPEAGQHLCERIFKVITEKSPGNQEITIPTSIADIAYITRAGTTDIIKIIERFRSPGKPFLTPYKGTDLNSDTIIDLTHESLIHLWPRLQKWVIEEADSVSMYNRLAEASRLYQRGQGNLWTSPKLEQATRWYEENEPTFQWSQRYNTAYERTIQFLNKSQEAFYLGEVEERETPLRRRNTRIFIGLFLILVAGSAFLFYYFSDSSSQVSQQPNFAAQNENPVQLPLTAPGDQEEEPDESLQNTSDQNRDLPDLLEEPDITQEAASEQSQSNQSQDIENSDPANRVLNQITEYQRPVESSRQFPEVQEPDTDTRNEEVENTEPSPEEIQRQIAENRRRLDQQMRENNSPRNEPSQSSAQVTREQPSPVSPVDEETFRNRVLAAAQTLAVRSQQMEGDSELKALLALQSYIFNREYNGTNYNSDIYQGLMTSVKSLYGNSYNVYKGHTESVNSLVFRPNSTIFYSASSDGKVLQWDINDENKRPKTLIQGSVVYNRLAISDNAQWLAVATDGQGILLFNPSNNNPNPIQINWGNNRINALDFHPDNEHIIFAGSDNSLVKRNIRTNRDQVITKSDAEILSLSVSPDGRMIAAGTRAGQVIIFRDGATPASQILYSDQGNDVLSVQFDRNSARIAAGMLRGEVRVLRVNDGNLIGTLRGHSARVVDIDFCPDNKLIATSSFDGTVHLWDAQNLGSPPVVLRDHGSWVRTVAFNSSGTHMVTGSRQETRLMAWSVNSNNMASMICDRITRSITREEWDRYIGDDIPFMEPCLQLSNN